MRTSPGYTKELVGALGSPSGPSQLVGPVPCLDFLGFELDSEAMEIRLPQPKLAELRELIQSWLGRKSCTKKELQSLVGKLSHASRVIQPGKTFMRRMFELLGGTRLPHHRIRLNLSFRSDLLWWGTFMDSWNGVSMMGTPDRG